MKLRYKIGLGTLAAGTLATIAIFDPGKHVEPLGYGDINGDGIEDVIVSRPAGNYGRFDEIGFVNGKYLFHDESGDLRAKPYVFRPLRMDLVPRGREGIDNRFVVIDLNDNNRPDLEMHTQVDLEAPAGYRMFLDV